MARTGRHRHTARALSLGWGDGTGGEEIGPPSAPPHDPHRSSPDGPCRGRASRTRRLLVIGLGLILVIALSVGLPRLVSATDGPEQAATDFLQAIIDGDLDQVLAHVEDAPDASSAALTPEILEAATGRLKSFTIDDVDVSADTAVVTATLDTGERTSTVHLGLVARAGSAFAAVRWEPAPVSLPEFVVDVPVGVQEVRINDVPVAVEDLGYSEGYFPQIAVRLLPGTYELTVADPGPWLVAPRVELTAPPVLDSWREPIHDLQLGLDDSGRQWVQQHMEDRVEECLRGSSSLVGECPFDVAVPGDGEETSREEAAGTWALREVSEIEVHPMESYLWSVSGVAIAEFTPTEQGGSGAGAPEQVRIFLYGTAYIDPVGDLRLQSDASHGVSPRYCPDPETGEIHGIAITALTDARGEQTDPCAALG